MTISTTIKTLQVIMRKDVGIDGDAQRIGQLVWMLFLKIFDDKESEWEVMEARYRSPIPERLRWRNWAADPEGMTGDRLLEFCNNELFPQLKELSLGGNGRTRGFVVRSVFEDAYQYMKSGTLLRQVINKLNEAIDFNDSQNRHLLGDMYEQILRDLQSAGNAGEYYTPRAVTQFMVEMVDPQLGETVFDPACGTGGFLTCAIEHIRRHYVKTPEDEQTMHVLKPGGRAAIVLPDGTLFGEGVKTRIKERLLDECNLHTVVRLSNGVFAPYTGIKTNLLFFTKGERTKQVWYYEHPYPAGVKSYNKTKPIRIEEFAAEKKWWKGRKENEQAWKVPVDQIKANGFNLDIKNPHDARDDHGDPEELLVEYRELLGEIQQTRDALKRELAEALGGSRKGAKARR